MMASAEIALACGLKVRVGCQNRLCVNSDGDETLAYWDSRYVIKCSLTVSGTPRGVSGVEPPPFGTETAA